MLPAFALSFVAVPLTPLVDDGVISPVAESVVKAPVDAVVDPIGPGAANVAPPSWAALTDALQVKPVLMVQFSALADVLQLGMLKADGTADEAVALARTVFAATDESPDNGTAPQAAGVPDPVEMIVWPDIDPVGLINETGTVVVAKERIEVSAASTPARIRFI
ncbi:hypothetical protein BG58_31415 [Caballeronia jiangsuensis]|nr:hypothetical protein BG58_31415 [Caballeronia jiangsuensis]